MRARNRPRAKIRLKALRNFVARNSLSLLLLHDCNRFLHLLWQFLHCFYLLFIFLLGAAAALTILGIRPLFAGRAESYLNEMALDDSADTI